MVDYSNMAHFKKNGDDGTILATTMGTLHTAIKRAPLNAHKAVISNPNPNRLLIKSNFDFNN